MLGGNQFVYKRADGLISIHKCPGRTGCGFLGGVKCGLTKVAFGTRYSRVEGDDVRMYGLLSVVVKHRYQISALDSRISSFRRQAMLLLPPPRPRTRLAKRRKRAARSRGVGGAGNADRLDVGGVGGG